MCKSDFGHVDHALREYDTVGIANWFFHENSWFGQFRHALSKYQRKLYLRDLVFEIFTIEFRPFFDKFLKYGFYSGKENITISKR